MSDYNEYSFRDVRKGGGAILPVAGTTFNKKFNDIIEDLRIGDQLALIREPSNKYDGRAISVRLTDCRTHIGYIPRDAAHNAPDDIIGYVVFVDNIFPPGIDRNAGMRIKLEYHDKGWVRGFDEYIEFTSPFLDKEKSLQFLELASSIVGEPQSDSPYEKSSLTRVANAVKKLHSENVHIENIINILTMDGVSDEVIVEDIKDMGLIPNGVNIVPEGNHHRVIDEDNILKKGSLFLTILDYVFTLTLGTEIVY